MKAKRLPAPGEVFTFEVSPGTCVLFRVVDEVADTRCVVLTRWSGARPKKVPTAKTVFEVQPLKHHQWDRPMIGGWVREPPPEDVAPLGKVRLRRGEKTRVMHPREWVNATVKSAAAGKKVLPIASWDGLLREALAQWRWDHDRAAVEAEDAQREAAKQEAVLAAAQELLAARTPVGPEPTATRPSLDALAKETFFDHWSHAPAVVREMLEREVQAALKALRAGAGTRALKQLARRFEALNGEHGYSYDTIDEEELVGVLEKLEDAIQG